MTARVYSTAEQKAGETVPALQSAIGREAHLDGVEFRLIDVVFGDWAECGDVLWKRRFAVRGVSYFTAPEHVEDDNVKIGHVALWRNGTLRRIDWSPYLVLTEDQFTRLMSCGFPERVSYPAQLDEIEAAMERAA